MAKTNNEKIEELNIQLTQLENRKKTIQKRQQDDERKARTKRLIERGAILESRIPNPTNYTNEQIKAFLVKTIQPDTAQKFLDSLTQSDTDKAAAQPAWTKRPAVTTTTDKSEVSEQGAD
jgi:hypothetical protein